MSPSGLGGIPMFSLPSTRLWPMTATRMCRLLRLCASATRLFRPTTSGYVLRRDLAFRDNFKCALDAGQSAPVPAYLWPMLSALEIPALVIRAGNPTCSLRKRWQRLAPPIPASLRSSLREPRFAGDNPDGLVAAVHDFLSRTETVMTGVQPD